MLKTSNVIKFCANAKYFENVNSRYDSDSGYIECDLCHTLLIDHSMSHDEIDMCTECYDVVIVKYQKGLIREDKNGNVQFVKHVKKKDMTYMTFMVDTQFDCEDGQCRISTRMHDDQYTRRVPNDIMRDNIESSYTRMQLDDSSNDYLNGNTRLKNKKEFNENY
jgi:hypothetical protein